ncbi:hypothetical protein QBC38DRAFT_484028 [Podospora fimiseda]|uniref:CipC-like antibiotic response protein n=1 Tax=Podospora fimiseda TaxID=252190 RepID=A0AAN7BKA1_9PEZI|nr:hypothetical protein QBC38DRAFT_484028 [Podospora fimiseda]
MGLFSFHEAKRLRDSIYSSDANIPEEHHHNLPHELIGGAAAFEAMHLWEKEQRRQGKPVSHGFAKEALAALAGAEADKIFEKRAGGAIGVDREEARKHARKQAEGMYDEVYGGEERWDPGMEGHESMRG